MDHPVYSSLLYPAFYAYLTNSNRILKLRTQFYAAEVWLEIIQYIGRRIWRLAQNSNLQSEAL